MGAPAPVSIGVIDAFIVEALAATGCLGLGIAAQRRASATSRPGIASVSRSIARLPHRHRRAARAIVDLAREQLERHAHDGGDTYTAREALRSYLPETLEAYLAVPPGLREERRAGAPSADDQLRRQLRTLRAGLQRLQAADADSASSRLAANGAFLNERFGPPASPPEPASPAWRIAQELVDLLRAYLRRV